jgi:hypothetical protein
MTYDDNRIDYKLADLLHGDHPIEGDHMQRVVELHELMILHEATEKAGWTRHTGDWDWGATVTMKDGEKIGDTIWSIDFVLPEGVKLEDFTGSVDYKEVSEVRLEGQTGGEDIEDINRDVLIDSITNVYWEGR